MEGYLEKVQELLGVGEAFVSVTLVDAVGSTPADSGSKMLVTGQGLAFGTVGGGRVEAKAIEQAQEMLGGAAAGGGRTLFVDWNLQRDVKMTCGGAVKLFFEVMGREAWPVAIFGAGHVAQALVRTLLNLDCRVSCFDSRAEWVGKLPASPKLDAVPTEDLPGRVAGLAAGTFVVLMTKGHSTDTPILLEVLRRGADFPYVGVIGSDAKRAQLRRGIVEAGGDPNAFEAVRCPMGLALGSNHPYEIALSIAAEMVQVRGAIEAAARRGQ
jgi:xanthine dehydrogenase accessory factor